MIPPHFSSMIPSRAPACTTTAMRGKLGSEFETYISYNAAVQIQNLNNDITNALDAVQQTN